MSRLAVYLLCWTCYSHRRGRRRAASLGRQSGRAVSQSRRRRSAFSRPRAQQQQQQQHDSREHVCQCGGQERNNVLRAENVLLGEVVKRLKVGVKEGSQACDELKTSNAQLELLQAENEELKRALAQV